MIDLPNYVASEWKDLVAGGGVAIVVREALAFALRLWAAKLRADKDPTNDGIADVIDDASKRLAEKR